MKLWTANYPGNTHTAAAILNDRFPHLVPHLLTLHSPDGFNTIAVFRVTDDLYDQLEAQRSQPEGIEETIILSGGADGVKYSLGDGEKSR